MGYSGKKGFIYDTNSQSFKAGAHKHWTGCYDKDGNLNTHGRKRLAADRDYLKRARA